VNASTWRARTRAALGLRLLAMLTPVITGILATTVAAKVIFSTSHHWSTVTKYSWIAFLALLGAVVGHFTSKLSRKLLPLSTLLKMTLVFPDKAPSRMGFALRSGNAADSEKMREEFRKNGLSSNPQEAAEQVLTLINQLHLHDRRTRGHAERVRAWAETIGEELGLDDDDRNRLRWGALLHDIGKLAVPPEILNKVEKLTDDEWEILSRHPMEGERRIKPLIPWLGEWTRAVGGITSVGMAKGIHAACAANKSVCPVALLLWPTPSR
jgi:HD domain